MFCEYTNIDLPGEKALTSGASFHLSISSTVSIRYKNEDGPTDIYGPIAGQSFLFSTIRQRRGTKKSQLATL